MIWKSDSYRIEDLKMRECADDFDLKIWKFENLKMWECADDFDPIAIGLKIW
jgi:hypothetical protein